MDSGSEQIKVRQLVDHLFRYESGKMIAVLVKSFGTENLQLAEDVVQDALVEALKHWTCTGIPHKPAAWLYTVARNKALKVLKRQKYQREYATLHRQFEKTSAEQSTIREPDFSEAEIRDDQLRMMFTCCHPSLSADSQIALTLKTLCGFSISEIARAFISNNESINKRLVRARKRIREAQVPFEVPSGPELNQRLDVVLEAIYLLFNEGYKASSHENLIRKELCDEAMRLAIMLIDHPMIQPKSDVQALLALMQLNASRFEARQNNEGRILTLEEQDRQTWDKKLIDRGLVNLIKAATDSPSLYHILASISALHCRAEDFQSTDWHGILSLYNKLMEIEPTAIVALNRAVVLAQVQGPKAALKAIKPLSNQLDSYPLFHSSMGELYQKTGALEKAILSYQQAIELSSQATEIELLKRKSDHCQKNLDKNVPI